MKLSAFVQTLMLGAALALPSNALALDRHDCKVIEVATFSNRVHVQCQNGYGLGGIGGILRFFAVPTSSSNEATRLVTLGSAALMGAGDGRLEISFDSQDLTAESYGCNRSDCRRPVEILLHND